MKNFVSTVVHGMELPICNLEASGGAKASGRLWTDSERIGPGTRELNPRPDRMQRLSI